MQEAKLLEELAGNYKKKKKLNEQEKLQAEKGLEVLLQDSSYRLMGYSMMLSLPQDIVANTFLKIWLDSEPAYRQVLIDDLIEQGDYDGEAGYHRLIELIKQFIPVSEDVSVKLFAMLSEKLTKSCTGTPANKYAIKVKKVLIENGQLLKINSGLHNLPSDKKSCIAIVLMYGLALRNDNERIDEQTIKSLVDWLNSLGTRFKLPAGVLREIEKYTAKWPEELQRRCCDMGLISVVTTTIKLQEDCVEEQIKSSALDNAPEARQQVEQNSSVVPSISKEKDTVADKNVNEPKEVAKAHQKDYNTHNFNPIHCLEQLRNFISTATKTDQKKTVQLNEALIKADSERSKRISAERVLAEKENKISTLEKEIERLKADIVKTSNQTAHLEKQLHDEKLKAENDKNQLFEILEVKPQQQLEQSKNRLTRMLRTDYLDFKQVENEKMTVELGENLRIQLKNIFIILSDEGIKL